MAEEVRLEVRKDGIGWYMLCPECPGIEPGEPLYDWADTWGEAMGLAHAHWLEAHSGGMVVPELVALVDRVLASVHGMFHPGATHGA